MELGVRRALAITRCLNPTCTTLVEQSVTKPGTYCGSACRVEAHRRRGQLARELLRLETVSEPDSATSELIAAITYRLREHLLASEAEVRSWLASDAAQQRATLPERPNQAQVRAEGVN